MYNYSYIDKEKGVAVGVNHPLQPAFTAFYKGARVLVLDDVQREGARGLAAMAMNLLGGHYPVEVVWKDDAVWALLPGTDPSPHLFMPEQLGLVPCPRCSDERWDTMTFLVTGLPPKPDFERLQEDLTRILDGDMSLEDVRWQCPHMLSQLEDTDAQS